MTSALARRAAVLSLGLLLAAASVADAKPAPKKPEAARTALPSAGDMRDPASLIEILGGLGAKAQVAKREGDSVFVTVTSPAETFSAQYAGCNDKGRTCQAVLFDSQSQTAAPSLTQLNGFNQTSVVCRLYQDKAGRPHVEYSALLFARDGRAEMLTHINAWRGCIGDFNAFQKDPNGFLAGAP